MSLKWYIELIFDENLFQVNLLKKSYLYRCQLIIQALISSNRFSVRRSKLRLMSKSLTDQLSVICFDQNNDEKQDQNNVFGTERNVKKVSSRFEDSNISESVALKP